MALGLVGTKCGMTRVFTDAGESIPVTVVEIQPNRVAQVKTVETDGYTAVQLTTGKRRATRVTKPMAGHFAKAGVEAGRGMWEMRVEPADLEGVEPGHEYSLDVFSEGQMVDATGTSIGKGFQGGVKRHNFRTQDATHGNSLSHRVHGSTGQNQSPGKVFKGKKMAGQLGNTRVTEKNLKVVQVNVEGKYILVHGAIPGAKGGYVLIRPSVQKLS